MLDCIKPEIEPELDILTNFINEYDLLVYPKDQNISRVYNYKECAKIIILLNLSCFNIFPIESNLEFEKIRKINKPLFVTFLWYLKDLYWDFYSHILLLKNDIKSYFKDEKEYNKLSDLLEYYPIRMVQAKEFFYTHHDTILREVVDAKLAAYDKAKADEKKAAYRYNADFYILNKELQAFEKLKEKIYAKSRKLKKTDEEIEKVLATAYKHHLRRQKFLDKILFIKRIPKPEGAKKIKPVYPELLPRDSIKFLVGKKKTVVKTYNELIDNTLSLFLDTLELMKIDEPYKEEVYTFNEPDIYKKIFKLKLIEPNLFNKFKDYCYIAIDRYTDKTITHCSQFIAYQHEFIAEFVRDIMWGAGVTAPREFKPILYKPTNRRRRDGAEVKKKHSYYNQGK